MDKKEYLACMEARFKHFYDLERSYTLKGHSVDLYARYFERNERYIGTKKMVVYGMEQNEHVFFKYLEDIKPSDLKVFTEMLETAVETLVSPTEDHMCTLVRGVLLTKNLPKELEAPIKKYKYYKSFLFGFRGWVHIGLNVVDINNPNINYHNRKGKEGKEILICDTHQGGKS